MEYKVYLSGGMSGLSFEEQTQWRKDVEDGIWEQLNRWSTVHTPVFFNPVDYYNFQKVRHKSEREAFEFDLQNLKDSRLVIVNFNDTKSIGTAMELAIAKDRGIPIIGLNQDKVELHPWLAECCTRICDSMDELIDYVVEFYLQFKPLRF